MENMTSADLAQLLYVAYYGRPADEAGQQFWAARIDEVGVEGIAADFGNSTEFDTEFGDMGSVALINNLYEQLFGRQAEDEGLQYWLDVLADGTPLASIAYAIAEGAQGGDATGLQNKVTLSNQFTAAVAAGDVTYEGVDAVAYGREFLASINENTNVETYDVQAVVNNLESGELPVDTSDLRQGLQDLREAEEAVDTFLVNALENEDVAEVAGPTAETATSANIDTAVTATQGELVTALDAQGATGFAAATGTNARQGLIADAKASAQADVDTAQGNLDDLNAAIDAVTGLRTAITNYNNALEAQEEAIAAFNAADASLDGSVVTFANLNDNIDGGTADTAATIAFVGDRPDATSVTADGVEVLTFNAETDEYEIATTGENLAGVQAFQAAVQAEYDASVALAEANSAEDTALANLEGVEISDEQAEDLGIATDTGTGANVASNLATAEANLVTAQETQEELDAAVVSWEAAVSLQTELAELNTAIDDAEAYLVDPVEDGGLGIDLIEDFDTTGVDFAGDEVYLFAESTGIANEVTLGSFGTNGVDRIFFGPDYSLVELAEGETIDSRVGSASELEIFWTQGDTGLELFVESAVTSGNATNDEEITTITLTGVNAEDISFTSGFLSAGTATEIA